MIALALMSARGARLLPFGLNERVRKLYGYWHAILPDSKRDIRGNRMFVDNTDVQPPRPDGLRMGGGFGAGAGSLGPLSALKSIELVLDGVFFVDGSFAGPDSLRRFERVTADNNARVEVAKIAREGHNRGFRPRKILRGSKR